MLGREPSREGRWSTLEATVIAGDSHACPSAALALRRLTFLSAVGVSERLLTVVAALFC